MTITPSTERSAAILASLSLYRDIHKGLRSVLFGVVSDAGRIDPSSRSAREALAGQAKSIFETLEAHAAHEDTHVQPALEMHLPGLAARIEGDHAALASRTSALARAADETVEERPYSRAAVQQLYLDLAAFAGEYLAHQDLEERTVKPALLEVVGGEAVDAIEVAIVASIPPAEKAHALGFMLPAMNVEDRVQLLTGMQSAVPPEIFQGVWGLAATVLDPRDHAELSVRLGIPG